MDSTHLRIRHQKLQQAIKKVREQLSADQIAEEELQSSRVKLRYVIEAFDKELQSSSDHLETEQFTDYLTEQLEAEELEVRLN